MRNAITAFYISKEVNLDLKNLELIAYMNKIKEQPSTGEGWAVHIYDSDRRLRFTLEASHIGNRVPRKLTS